MMKRLGLFCVATIMFMAIATAAYAHFLAYSAVDDQGADEVMHYAVTSGAEVYRTSIDNATKGANSWDFLDCYWATTCKGVNWIETTVADAQSRDDALVFFVQPQAIIDPTTRYGAYQHRDGAYDYVTFYSGVFNTLPGPKRKDAVLHETGHALGEAHAPCTNVNSVMVTGCFNVLGKPGEHDKTDYKKLWITYNGPGSFATTAEETPENDPTITQTSDGYEIAESL